MERGWFVGARFSVAKSHDIGARRMRSEVYKSSDTDIDSFREFLVERLGRERYEVWFRGVRFELRSCVLTVFAPDQFTLDRLRNRFRVEIQHAASRTVKGGVEVSFNIDESLKPTRPSGSFPALHRKTVAPDSPSGPELVTSGEEASSVSSLSRRPTLSSFVVGDHNRVAVTAATTMLRKVGVISPLLVYGPPGCGKTHLLRAIQFAARQKRGVVRAIYLSADQFTTYFLEALRGSGLPSFRRKYRDVQLLLIDNVQFFAGKRATMVELQHTMDELSRQGRQLVLAADRPPAQMSELGPELIARMSGGVVCGMESADCGTRLAILRQLTQERELAVPGGVLKMLAEQMSGDVRQLQGAMNRLNLTSEALGCPVTREMAEATLADVLSTMHRAVGLTDISKAVCGLFGLEPCELKSERRTQKITQPRMLAMWLARKYTRAAYSEIGDFFGNRAHSTVISAQQKVDGWVSAGSSIRLGRSVCQVADAIRQIESQLQAG